MGDRTPRHQSRYCDASHEREQGDQSHDPIAHGPLTPMSYKGAGDNAAEGAIL
jgi:hypothetical protein